MGRKSLKDEILMKRVVDLSYKTIHSALKAPDSEVTQAEKRRIALELCKKTAPKKLDLGGKAVDSFTTLMKQFWLKKKAKTNV